MSEACEAFTPQCNWSNSPGGRSRYHLITWSAVAPGNAMHCAKEGGTAAADWMVDLGRRFQPRRIYLDF